MNFPRVSELSEKHLMETPAEHHGEVVWAAVESYMRRGLLPPVLLAARLPKLTNRGVSKHDQWILAGCRRALRVQRDWCDAILKNMINFGEGNGKRAA